VRGAILGATALLLTACTTAAPPATSRADRWQNDLNLYREQLERFNAEALRLLEDFQSLRANPNFAAMEGKIRDLAAQSASGDKADANGLIIARLYTMSVGQLLAFPKFLALSTRSLTLDATRSELESLRLGLWVRRIALEREASRGMQVVQKVGMPSGGLLADRTLPERPVPFPLACLTYVVGDLAFTNCFPATP
jgi:hypothetical protein